MATGVAEEQVQHEIQESMNKTQEVAEEIEKAGKEAENAATETLEDLQEKGYNEFETELCWNKSSKTITILAYNAIMKLMECSATVSDAISSKACI